MVVVFNSFLSYLLLFVILAALAIVGAVIGVKLRQSKNAKEALSKEVTEADDTIEE